MNTIFHFLMVSLLAFTLSACDQNDSATKALGEQLTPAPEARVFWFAESESGVEPYRVRMIVTPGYLRMDEGNPADNYLLFDRKSLTIHSVNHEEQTILRMPRRLLNQQVPESVQLGQKQVPADDIPAFGGQTPVHMRYTSGTAACYDVIAVPGFEDDAVSAMREYLLTLSGEQLQNLDKTPSEMRSECMMANLIYAPVRHLDLGFPLREWDYKGYLRELVSIETLEPDAALFQLEPDYRVYELSPIGVPAQVN